MVLRNILYEFLPIETKYLFSVKRLYPGIKLTINLAYYYKGNQRREKNKENYVLFQGKSSYTRPPPLTPGGYELYDSCVDNLSNHQCILCLKETSATQSTLSSTN